MPITDTDLRHLERALTLAESAIGLSDPNPRVGCVLADAQGRVVGEGFTQQAGGPHAEVMALRAARAAGADLRGGTAWVSLEPCAHHGRTPPCCDALVDAGLGRVVAAAADPNPLVAGRGLGRLRAAGLEVTLADGAITRRTQELNIGFWSRMRRGRPWLRLKMAASLDGRSALADGRSQWITGEAARIDGHAWRRRAGALLTGIGTVRADDPRLDVRLVPTARQPLRVVVDARLDTPPGARLLAPPGSVLLFHACDDPARAVALASPSCELARSLAPGGRIDLAAVLVDLGARGINELHVECGPRLAGGLWQAGLVDEWLVYLAPKLIGPGRDLADLPPLPALDQARPMAFTDLARVGDDLRIVARVQGRDAFLHGA